MHVHKKIQVVNLNNLFGSKSSHHSLVSTPCNDKIQIEKKKICDLLISVVTTIPNFVFSTYLVPHCIGLGLQKTIQAQTQLRANVINIYRCFYGLFSTLRLYIYL
jgi:hypothetical protein